MAYTFAYRGGDQSIFAYAIETGTYPNGTTYTLPAATGLTPLYPGYADIPDVVVDEGSRNGYGGGYADPLYSVAGNRTIELGVNVRIATPSFIANSMRSASGTAPGYGMNDLCLFYGPSNTYGNGYTRAIRFARANSINFNYSEQGDPELTAALSYWGLADDASAQSSALAPNSATLAAAGTPLCWHNVVTASITDGASSAVDYRGQISAFSLGINYNLERKGVRVDAGDNASGGGTRIAYQIMPKQITYTCSMTFHSPVLATALVDGTATANKWGSIVLTANNSAAGGSKSAVLTIGAARLLRRRQNGGDLNTEMTGTVDVVVSGVAFTYVD